MRHQFTKEEARAGGRGRNFLKATRMQIKAMKHEQWMELLKTAMLNPSVVGALAFIAVYEGWNPGSLGALFKIGPISVPNPGVIAGTIGKDSLLAALALYVASGGNLAGTLQGGGELLGTLLKSMPAAEAVSAGA